jgi:hypothetical protein
VWAGDGGAKSSSGRPRRPFVGAGVAGCSLIEPSACESFLAASTTIGINARGLGGRIRSEGEPIRMAATTWPDASRTGAQTLTVPATTSESVMRKPRWRILCRSAAIQDGSVRVEGV